MSSKQKHQHSGQRARSNRPVKKPGDKVVLLGVAHDQAIADHRAITAGLTFLFQKEFDLENALLESFAEMSFVIQQFESAEAAILRNGTPELDGYIRDLNALSEVSSETIIELHAIDLSTYFKSFLLLARSVLDKVVPLYSYQFGGELKLFSEKGGKLIKAIRNGNKAKHKQELISIIEEAKAQWIDVLIDLRDEYAHYSSLSSYQNFWVSGASLSGRKLKGIDDFTRPTIEINGHPIVALDYMKDIKQRMISFLNDFLARCDFTPGRRPKRYLNCENCGRPFATREKNGKLRLASGPIQIAMKNRDLDYGVVVCSHCGGTTDTDISLWKDAGLTMSPAAPKMEGWS